MKRPFTLLELLLVLTILAIIAGSATVMVGGQADQELDSANRIRINQLKTAICGDPNAGLGSPVTPISGFVSDMGRLPTSVSQLLNLGTQTAATIDTTSGTQYGWRGPYLSVIPDASGRIFRDTWGTINPVAATDALNYGWLFPAATAAGALSIQSLGKDGLAGGSNYDADIPTSGLPLISDADYNMSLSSLRFTQVNLVFANTANTNTYYTGTVRGKAMRIGFMTAVNAGLTWSTAAANPCLDLVSDQSLTAIPTTLALPANRTISYRVAPTASVPAAVTSMASPGLTFITSNSVGQSKRIACGRCVPVLLFDPVLAAGSTFKAQLVAKGATKGQCNCRIDFFFYPRAVVPASTTITFDILVP